MIIPPELLSIVSSHLSRSSKPFPVLFEIPPTYTLDRITAYPHLPPNLPTLPPSMPPPPIPDSSTLARIRNRSSVSEALQAAINSGLAAAAAASASGGGLAPTPSASAPPMAKYPWTDATFAMPMPKNPRTFSAPSTTLITLQDTAKSHVEIKNVSQ